MSVLTTPDAPGDLLTIAEVARQLRCSEPTVRRRIRAGDLAAVRIGDGRAIRVHRDAIADLLEPVVPGESRS
jgi:excisionase family DNA binding protein